MKKIIITGIVLSFLVLGVFSVYGLVGHPAEQVYSGNFNGEYSFTNISAENINATEVYIGNNSLKSTNGELSWAGSIISSLWENIAGNATFLGGKVGIGTSSPQAKLEVNGNIIADDPTSSNHVATKSYVDANGGGSVSDSKTTLHTAGGVIRKGDLIGLDKDTGKSYRINPINSPCSNGDFTKIGENKFALVCYDGVYIGNYTDGELKLGDANQLPEGSSSREIINVSNDKIVVLLYNSSGLFTVAGTINGDSVSFGAPVLVASDSRVQNSEDEYDIVDIGSDKFIFAFFDKSDNYNPYAVVGSVSGNSITLGSEKEVSISNRDYINLIKVGNDKALLGCSYSNYLYQYVLSVSGTTISVGSQYSYQPDGGASVYVPNYNGDGQGNYVVLLKTSDDSIITLKGSVSGTSSSISDNYDFYTSTQNYVTLGGIEQTDDYVFVFFEATSYGNQIRVSVINKTSFNEVVTSSYYQYPRGQIVNTIKINDTNILSFQTSSELNIFDVSNAPDYNLYPEIKKFPVGFASEDALEGEQFSVIYEGKAEATNIDGDIEYINYGKDGTYEYGPIVTFETSYYLYSNTDSIMQKIIAERISPTEFYVVR